MPKPASLYFLNDKKQGVLDNKDCLVCSGPESLKNVPLVQLSAQGKKFLLKYTARRVKSLKLRLLDYKRNRQMI